ncbi:MAG: putative toxin-antitoxin system toxin component, PIN family [Rhizobium sp.]|uniref:putative toxin-antitoxin system toxin component, PIN family n=1 Tax=Thiobacillus sp. TaxID=924 RepID=UPI0025F9E777|nr:putative toxin-antitoxin system toxin component, PIN family [Thiobacillus sp.]MBW8365547.1 putative toxin-antitoxin system toxin component, PIN family [Rhizobium sp.]
MSDTRIVLDTNVVLDLLHYDDAAARPLLHALEAGRIRCVVTSATLNEWRRVLAYPAFGLDSARQAALYARYQALAVLEPAAIVADLPLCRDADDQKFIELAATAHAQGLVSKDRAVLRLRRRCAARFRIMLPAEAVCWLTDALNRPAAETAVAPLR